MPHDVLRHRLQPVVAGDQVILAPEHLFQLGFLLFVEARFLEQPPQMARLELELGPVVDVLEEAPPAGPEMAAAGLGPARGRRLEADALGHAAAFRRTLIESLDADPRPPDEAEGELVLTTLDRIGSPLLRYRTGDLVKAAPSGECVCGRHELALAARTVGLDVAGLEAAFALGAIVSPPDAVAATAITRRLGVPQRIVTILEGESLVNDATALIAHCRENLASYKKPRRVFFLDDLPKNPSGKILKRELRDLART